VSYLDNYYFNKPKPMPEVVAASFETIGDWFAKDRRGPSDVRKIMRFMHDVLPVAIRTHLGP
jgi:hypothetical protein